MWQARKSEAAFLERLERDPADLPSLLGLGSIALATGRRDAARTLLDQAVRCHPAALGARVTLGNMALEDGEVSTARRHYQGALFHDARCAEAAQGMARALALLGEEAAAAPFWAAGFSGRAAVQRRYRGVGRPAAEVVYLAAARGANVRLWPWVDEERVAVTTIYVDFLDLTLPLPPHDLVINAIGDADAAAEGLLRAESLVASTTRPVINHPTCVRRTRRCDLPMLCRGIDGLIAPAMRRVTRSGLLDAAGLGFPVLVRVPGFHTGHHFLRVETQQALAAAAGTLPGEELLLIEALDARGSDGIARKYRVLFVQGRMYPWHLAISDDWKVHYFTSAMADNAAHRAEERQFLADMTGTLGAPALAALQILGQRMDLHFAGVDFGRGADGRLLIFEANAAMTISGPPPGPFWDYRRPAAEAVQGAVRRLLSGETPPPSEGVSP